MPASVKDRVTRERLTAIEKSLAAGLAKVDPFRRLQDRPVRYQVTAGQTLEITFRDVPSIAEAEVLGIKKLLGGTSFSTVSPQSRERFDRAPRGTPRIAPSPGGVTCVCFIAPPSLVPGRAARPG